MRIKLAITALFKTLFDRQVAEAIRVALTTDGVRAEETVPQAAPEEPPSSAPPDAARSDAITLLATLQREARFVDIVNEPLVDYTDEQIGAAARDVLRDCGRVLQRLFELRPVVTQEEGSDIEAPSGYDPGKFRLIGHVREEPPHRGQLVHHGWQALHCRVPQWSGNSKSVLIVSPVEIEMK